MAVKKVAHPSVEEVGHVADPGALMRGFDVLVLPSLEEGSALVTYEARACGCVLAVSDRSGAACTDGVASTSSMLLAGVKVRADVIGCIFRSVIFEERKHSN